MTERVRLTGAVNPIYTDDIYPEALMVVMSNGRVVRYRIDIYRPNRSFVTVMGMLRKTEYHGKHAKKEPELLLRFFDVWLGVRRGRCSRWLRTRSCR